MDETTRLIAQILGPFLLFAGLVYAVRADWARGIYAEFANSRALIVFSGAMTLMLGLVVLRLHDEWTSAPAIVISLIAAVSVGQGAIALAAPGLSQRSLVAISQSRAVVMTSSLISAALGAFLLYSAITGA